MVKNILKTGLCLAAISIGWFGNIFLGEAVVELVRSRLPGRPILIAWMIGHSVPLVMGVAAMFCLYWALKDVAIRGGDGVRTEAFEYPEGEAVWRIIVTGDIHNNLKAEAECYCRVGLWQLGLGHNAQIKAVEGKGRAKTYCTYGGCNRKFHSSQRHWDQTEPMKQRAISDFRKGIDPPFPVVAAAIFVVAVLVSGTAIRAGYAQRPTGEQVPSALAANTDTKPSKPGGPIREITRRPEALGEHESPSSRNKIVHDLSILLERGIVILRQCQGLYPNEFKPGETIRKKYDAWYSDVNASFKKLGLDSEVYHVKLENTPGYCTLPNPPPCISPEHCQVYCEISVRKESLSKIIQEFDSHP